MTSITTGSCSHLAKNRYTPNKSKTAVVALLVALLAVPALADTSQEKVVSRLSSETSTGSQNSPGKQAIQSGTQASLQMSREVEQGSYQEKVIRRLSSEVSTGAAGKQPEMEEVLQSAHPIR